MASSIELIETIGADPMQKQPHQCNCKSRKVVSELDLTIRDIVKKKVLTFTEEECIEKLIEELDEALLAAHAYLSDVRHHTIVRMVPYVKDSIAVTRAALSEELADVYVSGILTLGTLRPFMQTVYDAKVHRAVFKQMVLAIDQRQQQ